MRKFGFRVLKDYECYEFEDRLYNISLTWYGRKDSIPDRNDLGEVNFISWSIDPMSIAVEEILDDGETKDIDDTKLIDKIIDTLDEPEEAD